MVFLSNIIIGVQPIYISSPLPGASHEEKNRVISATCDWELLFFWTHCLLIIRMDVMRTLFVCTSCDGWSKSKTMLVTLPSCVLVDVKKVPCAIKDVDGIQLPASFLAWNPKPRSSKVFFFFLNKNSLTVLGKTLNINSAKNWKKRKKKE